MPVDRKISKEIQLVQNIKQLTVVYEEIAVMKINKTKNSVLHTRQFYTNLSGVFYNIKLSYNQQLLALLQGKKHMAENEREGAKKNTKEVHVLLSANNKLYGDILNHVFLMFYEKTSQKECDLVILGNVGKTMYEAVVNKKPYTFFPLSDSRLELNELKPILEHLSEYAKVYIYYGKFVSVLKQEPTVTDITGDQPAEQTTEVAPHDLEPYLFEPSIKHVHSVFELQIFYSLFKQTLSEISLARSASRIKAMEKTNENISLHLKKLNRREKLLQHMVQNKKQLQQLANVAYFRKRKSLYAKG